MTHGQRVRVKRGFHKGREAYVMFRFLWIFYDIRFGLWDWATIPGWNLEPIDALGKPLQTQQGGTL